MKLLLVAIICMVSWKGFGACSSSSQEIEGKAAQAVPYISKGGDHESLFLHNRWVPDGKNSAYITLDTEFAIVFYQNRSKSSDLIEMRAQDNNKCQVTGYTEETEVQLLDAKCEQRMKYMVNLLIKNVMDDNEFSGAKINLSHQKRFLNSGGEKLTALFFDLDSQKYDSSGQIAVVVRERDCYGVSFSSIFYTTGSL